VSELVGRRLKDSPSGRFPLPYDELRPGDYWKILDPETGEPVVVTDHPSNLTGCHWFVVAPGPNGIKMFANLLAHTVREHDDATITVAPGDGSSNSILVTRREDLGETWHGYIDRGVWREA
jgi:hypothetical protein